MQKKMEINALFDLWDKFSSRMDHYDDHLTEHFYEFPVGTACTDVIKWFSEQNPYFVLLDHKDGQTPKYIAMCVPAKADDDKPKEVSHEQPEPEPPRYA
jgi:hypothetical protein